MAGTHFRDTHFRDTLFFSGGRAEQNLYPYTGMNESYLLLVIVCFIRYGIESSGME